MTASGSAVLSLHLQNYTLDPTGPIGGRGSAQHAASVGLVGNVGTVFAAARATSVPIIHVAVGFDEHYTGMNDTMPIFAGLRASGELKLGSWGVEFHPEIPPVDGEPVLYHGGLGPFAGTPLDRILVNLRAEHLIVFGVSTRWVVEAAVFEALDRGYRVTVVSDCSAAADAAMQEEAESTLVHFGELMTATEVVAKYLTS